MAIRQTYESHLVGIGTPLTGNKWTGAGLFTDTVKWLPFAQGFAYSISQDRVQAQGLGASNFEFQKQQNLPDIGVTIRQFDHALTGSVIWQDLNLQSRSVASPSSGVSLQNILARIITGHRDCDGAAIYFLTDTGEMYRDQIAVPTGNTGYSRQMAVIDPCYLSSLSWSVGYNTVATFEYGFVGNYVSVTSQTKGNSTWDWNLRRALKTGNSGTGRITFDSIQESGTYINVQNANSIFIGRNISVTGAPDYGTIRGARWSIEIPRQPINSLGFDMPLDRKPIQPLRGTVSIEYNYEGQEIDEAQTNDIEYDITFVATSPDGSNRVMRLDNCLIESTQLNAEVIGGPPDSYSVNFSFPVHYGNNLSLGLREYWN